MKQGVAAHDHAPVLLITHIRRVNDAEGGIRIQENVVTEARRGVWRFRLGRRWEPLDLVLL